MKQTIVNSKVQQQCTNQQGPKISEKLKWCKKWKKMKIPFKIQEITNLKENC